MASREETELYVTGIPIDLDQKGLQNMFAAAGAVERVKIFPPKNSSHTSSYGFVTFKTRSAAATALEMFRNHKIGSHYIRCQISMSSNSANSNSDGDRDRALPPLPPSSSSAINPDYRPRQTIQQREPAADNNNLDIDLSKHYAQLYLKRRNSNPAYAAPDYERKASVTSPTDRDRFKPAQNGLAERVQIERERLTPVQPAAPSPPVVAAKPAAVETRSILKSPPVMNQEPKPAAGSNVRMKLMELMGGTNKDLKISKHDSLEIGRLYPVVISHVITPSNFFVQLKSSEKKTGNVMNNVNNCYINEDMKQYDLKVDDFCACLFKSFWFRGQVLRKSASKRTYHVRLVDFGDSHEFPYRDVRRLRREFCDTERSSIRCKLAGLVPKDKSGWDPQSMLLFDRLNQFSVEMKIVDREEFEPSSGRFEYIYSVDLILDKNESFIPILIEFDLAIKLESDERVDERVNLYYRVDFLAASSKRAAYDSYDEDDEEQDDLETININSNNYEFDEYFQVDDNGVSATVAAKIDMSNSKLTPGAQPRRLAPHRVYDDEDEDGGDGFFDYQRKLNKLKRDLNANLPRAEVDDEMEEMRLGSSVSMNDLRYRLLNKQGDALANYMVPYGRNKMFNGTFLLYKKRDLIAVQGKYKAGQALDVKMAFVDDSKRFFVHPVDRLEGFRTFESSIQRYAARLLEDDGLEELHAFQVNSAKHDVVLVKCADGQWRRSFILEMTTTNEIRKMMFESDDSDGSLVDGFDFFDKDLKSYEQQCKKAAAASVQKKITSFYLIDWGREETMMCEENSFRSKSDLYILPVSEKIMQVGCYALRCSLDETKYFARVQHALRDVDKDRQERLKRQFEKKFAELLRDRFLKMTLTTISEMKGETNALVELFFLERDLEALCESLDLTASSLLNSSFVSSSSFDSNLSSLAPSRNIEIYNKFNCIKFIIRLLESGQTDTRVKDQEADRPGSSHLSRKSSSCYDQSETDHEVSSINSRLEKKVQITKIFCPEPIRLGLDDMPQLDVAKTVVPQAQFIVYAQKINLLYVLSTEAIEAIQQKVDAVVKKIMEERDKYDPIDPNDRELAKKYLPERGNLVYAKYREDDAWYRCVVTNCNQEKRKYELFFIDFGNTEVNQLDEILLGWKPEHVSLFQEYEPQAIKCRFFGVRPVNKDEYSIEENAFFKEITTDRLFEVDLINFNEKDQVHEVNLHEVTEDGVLENSVLQELLEKEAVEFPKFNKLVATITTQVQLDFYSNLLAKLSPLIKG